MLKNTETKLFKSVIKKLLLKFHWTKLKIINKSFVSNQNRTKWTSIFYQINLQDFQKHKNPEKKKINIANNNECFLSIKSAH